MSLELPKPLVLASVALRVRRTAVDEFAGLAEDGHMALGPVLHVELLQLPQVSERVYHSNSMLMCVVCVRTCSSAPVLYFGSDTPI
mgnify:CR=1 FL=1